MKLNWAGALIRSRIDELGLEQSDLRLNYARDVAAPALAQVFNAKRVWLFGSSARNAASMNSDIDLLVEGGEGIPGKSRLALACDTVSELPDIPCGIDVVVLTESEIQQKSSVSSIKSMLKDRKLIYGR